jgi:hypothetical protein
VLTLNQTGPDAVGTRCVTGQGRARTSSIGPVAGVPSAVSRAVVQAWAEASHPESCESLSRTATSIAATQGSGPLPNPQHRLGRMPCIGPPGCQKCATALPTISGATEL